MAYKPYPTPTQDPTTQQSEDLTHRHGAILCCVFVGLLIFFLAAVAWGDHQTEKRYRASQATFEAGAKQSEATIAQVFSAWKDTTSKNGQIYEWSGKEATLVWVRPLVTYHTVENSLLVYAVTPNQRYFTVAFFLDDKGQLNGHSKMREWDADDMARSLKQVGPHALDKMRLVRTPA